MIKTTTYIFVFLMSFSLFSQVEKLNNYKYIVVSNQFDFLRVSDQYKTSSLTKFLLKKKGFQVFLSNELLPEELATNRCLGLEVNVINKSGMLTTKNAIEFKDCYNKIIFTTAIGKSKDKDYKRAYHEAIRNAYNTISDFTYNYQQTGFYKNKEVISKKNTINSVPNNVIASVKTKTKVIPKSNVKKEEPKKEIIKPNLVEVLYAQSKNNGFQLVNTKSEVVFMILKSNLKDVFIIKDKNGILYKVGEKWVAEYYKNNVLVKKEYQIKF